MPAPTGNLALLITIVVAGVSGLAMADVFVQGTLAFKLLHAAQFALAFLGYKVGRDDTATALAMPAPAPAPKPPSAPLGGAPLVALLLAYSMLLPYGCAWWASKGKAEAVAAAKCVESDMASQAALIISKFLAGDFTVLATIGGDLLDCVAAGLVQMPSALESMPGPGLVSRRDVALMKVKAEQAKRKAGGK